MSTNVSDADSQSHSSLSSDGHLYVRDRKDTGYTVITSVDSEGNHTTIHAHQLVACLGNDPYEVFGEGTMVHHRLASPEPIDIPGNLTVMDAGDHARLHDSGEAGGIPVEEVLDGGE